MTATLSKSNSRLTSFVLSVARPGNEVKSSILPTRGSQALFCQLRAGYAFKLW